MFNVLYHAHFAASESDAGVIMAKGRCVRSVTSIVATFVLLLSSPLAASADSRTITFEPPTYHTGTIDHQDGWAGTGGIVINPAIDEEVVLNTYGYPQFGHQSWRFSNAYADGAFGTWPFSPSLANEAGEADAQPSALSGGDRQNFFAVQWDFASTVKDAEQPGLQMSTAPDRGDGARMSFVRLSDLPAGLRVEFADYQDRAPFGSTTMPTDGCGDEDGFVITTIASGLRRDKIHTVRLTMEFVDGPRNDVVRVYVDGSLRITGTSWEDFFRWGPGIHGCEATQSSRTVDSMIFQARNIAAPATVGNGFLIDNLSYFSSQRDCPRGSGNAEFANDKGQKHHGRFLHDRCENRGQVEDTDLNSGQHFESSSVDSATFTSSADSETLTMIGTGLDDGVPVGFTMIAVDYRGLAPAVYSLTLTNGRNFTGTLVSGTLTID